MDSVSRNAGGLFDAGRRLAQGLHALGEDVRVLGVNDDKSQDDMMGWSPVQVETHPGWLDRRFGYSPSLSKGLCDFEPDVLHSHGLWTGSSAAAFRWHRRSGRPECIHPHGMLDPWALQNSAWKKRLVLALFERSHLREASCIRALCQSELESIRRLGLTNPVCVIPNGVDLAEERPERSAEPWMQDKKILLYLGRLHPKKGLLVLLDGWAQLHREGAVEDWILAVAGWDQNDHEAELKKRADEGALPWIDLRTGGAERGQAPLVFTGPRFGEDKGQLYRACEAFVLPSVSEGLPMVILDAWAHGKPVVMTAACNLPEGFQVGAALEVRPEGESLKTVLRTMTASSHEDRAAMGARGKRLVSERFTWQRVAGQMHLVNQWLLHGGAAPSCVA